MLFHRRDDLFGKQFDRLFRSGDASLAAPEDADAVRHSAHALEIEQLFDHRVDAAIQMVAEDWRFADVLVIERHHRAARRPDSAFQRVVGTGRGQQPF
jgi:hypothetical protein